jgi:CHAD domain-containing protein
MTATRIPPTQLAKAFNRNIATVETRLQDFVKSGDSATTAALRKGIGRLRTTYSVLPKSVKREKRVKRYLSASRKLSRALGKVRDTDTIAAWTMQISQGKDQRSFISDLDRIRATNLRAATLEAKELRKTEAPTLDVADVADSGNRADKVQKRLAKRVDKEFEEFLSTQEVDVMHALRKDSKRLRHLLELTERGEAPPLLARLRSIQDDLGAIRDHDLVIDYLRSRVRLTSTRSLVREEIAKRHARLEEFVTKNRGQGHVVPVAAK